MIVIIAVMIAVTVIIAVMIAVTGTVTTNVIPADADEDKPVIHNVNG